ncbi:protein mini spindles [Ctenocephalides felis]|uniref:protein mini spindles n=1 Tax=Ctenocephalides felis TaxID=7515 RepID=UPI000E6E34A0|nr:protein mini spindles [Ctenocephalides felis]XP_026480506.1 protein mini spindles [Ctenocephalides felis]
MEEDTDFKKLPVEERCAHKLWKARVDGYEEATKIFRLMDDEKSREWMKYLGMLKKFVSDSHALAQEKGLEASLAFVENSSFAGRTVEDVMNAVVTKCIAAPKARTKELAQQLALAYIEIEKQEAVVEALVQGTEHKNPKIAAACIATLSLALKEFGGKAIDLKPLIKRAPALLTGKDPNVRAEGKILTIELSRWALPAVKQLISSLPAVLVGELESEFTKAAATGPPAPTRLLRSQQKRQAEQQAAGGGGGGDGEDNADGEIAQEASIDPFDLLDPVDILSQLPKDFYEKLESKKWQERRESLDALDGLLNNAPKLASGDYGDLVKALKHVLAKDTNVLLVATAGKCLGSMAKGLKNGFTPYALVILGVILEKFKEKKQNVVLAIRDAADAAYTCTTPEALAEDVCAALNNKNPSIRMETCSFLARAFTRTQPAHLSNKKLLKQYASALVKCMNDPDPVVREQAANAIGTSMKLLGERTMQPYLTELDEQKMNKIKEFFEKAVIVVVIPKVIKKPEVKKPEPAAAAAGSPKVKPAGKMAYGKKPVIKKPSARPSSASISAPAKNNSPPEPAMEEAPTAEVATTETGAVDVSSQITDALIAELSDKNWNTRHDALTKISAIIGGGPIKAELGDLPQALAARLVDSNSKIAQNALALCQTIATNATGANAMRRHARTLFPGFVHGLGDGKAWIRTASLACMDAWGDRCGYHEFLEGEMIHDALKEGSPTLRAELWSWLAKKLPNIPPKKFHKDELLICLPILFSNIEDRNAEVRKNAADAVTAFMIHLGYERMIRGAEKLKPASLTVVKGVLDRARGNLPELSPPDEPASKGASKILPPSVKGRPSKMVRTKSGIAKLTNGSAGANNVKKEEEAEVGPILLINNLKHQRMIDEQKLRVLKWNFTTPREEFVELLKDQMTAAGVSRSLMVNMFHGDFRYHVKVLESLTDCLNDNGWEPTAANLDLILKWLTLRFFDTNPTVLMKGIDYLQLAFQMLIDQEYQLSENEASSFVPYLILKVGDPKEPIRIGVRALFRQLCHVYSPNKLFAFVLDGLKSKNARQRQECLDELGVLIAGYGITVCQPSPLAALKEVVKQVSDRDNAVRNAALNCVVQVYYIQQDKVYKLLSQLQLSEKDQSLLDERIKRASKSRPSAAFATIVKNKPAALNVPIIPDNLPEAEVVIEGDSDGEAEFEQREPSPPPQRTMNETKSISPPRRIPGPYGLDTKFIAEIERKRRQLVDTKEDLKLPHVDLGFLDEPVQPLPTCSRLPMPLSGIPTPAAIMKPPPVISVPISTSSYDLEALIRTIGSADLQRAINAMSTMEDAFNKVKANQLIELEDKFISACVEQFKSLSRFSIVKIEDVSKGYQALFTILTSFYENKVVGRRVTIPVLRNLMESILTLLADKSMEMYNTNSAYNRVLNSLCFKILERSDHSNITCAMIRLMGDCHSNANVQPPTHAELVMKCLWKITKNWAAYADDMDYDLVFSEINKFYSLYPGLFWKKRCYETPFKTVKTILHSIVKNRGPPILQHVQRLNPPAESELALYIVKLVKSAFPDATIPYLNYHHSHQDSSASDGASSLPPSRKVSSQNHHDQLSIIFRKIGTKTQTKEGLLQLYEFQESNPDVDIKPFLKESTEFFKSYIENGLRDIERQRRANKAPSSGAGDNITDATTAVPSGMAADSQQPRRDPTYYLNRLKEMQGKQKTDNMDDNRYIGSAVRDENLNSMNSNTNKEQEVSGLKANDEAVRLLRRKLELLKGNQQ